MTAPRTEAGEELTRRGPAIEDRAPRSNAAAAKPQPPQDTATTPLHVDGAAAAEPADERRRCVTCGEPTVSAVDGVPLHLWCRITPVALSARFEDPSTSHQAARANPVHRSRLRQLVQREHELHRDGLTDDELAELLPDEHLGSISKRRGELVGERILEDSGQRRPTRRGVDAVVWRVTR